MTAAVKGFLRTLTLILMTSVLTSRSLNVEDLTHPLGSDTLFWPGEPGFKVTINEADGNSWTETKEFTLGEHGGTHVDAPAYFVKGGKHTHSIMANNLVGPGVMIDLKQQAKANDMYAVTKEDLMTWETDNGKIPENAVVLLNFGWGERYPNPRRVFNTETPDNVTTFRYPGLSADAVNWLMDNRNLRALGVDTPRPDLPNDTTFPAHKILLGKDVLILNYVANLDSLPAKGFDVIIGVIKLEGGTGGPARILALLNGASSAAIAFIGGEGGHFFVVVLMVMLSVWGWP